MTEASRALHEALDGEAYLDEVTIEVEEDIEVVADSDEEVLDTSVGSSRLKSPCVITSKPSNFIRLRSGSWFLRRLS